MKYVALSIALAVSACEQERQEASPGPVATETPLPEATRVSRPPEVVPLPKDQADLDRLILAGYTLHAEHLHPPGVKSCPLAKGNEAVM